MYIYRNYTIELLFQKFEAKYSGYGDISTEVNDVESDVVVFFYQIKPIAREKEVVDEINDISTKINFLFNRPHVSKNILIILPDTNFFNKLVISSNAIGRAYSSLEDQVIDLCNENKSIKYVEFNDFTKKVGQENLIDWKYYYTSEIIINPRITGAFTQWFSVVLNSISFKRKKCVVLDCDNTLWGGIIGEDGINGIKIGNTYPGNVFRDFQLKLVELYEQGIILAICSKNNLSDVEEVFQKHPEMRLKMEHISANRINWDNKAQNIREIAAELNIGLDSIIFIDDNPHERELVKFNIKEIEAPEFPRAEFQIVQFFNGVCERYFTTYKVTEEDKGKTAQYLENAKRESFKAAFTNLDDYLATLDIQIDLQSLNNLNISRCAQMTQKTNQFNLTTRRYSEADLELLAKQGHLIVCASVKDKFGDNGITILSVVRIQELKASIDSYLLSCRILGRGVEKAVLQFILNQLYDKGITEVEAEYIPTEKNSQTRQFFEGLGFECTGVNETGAKKYVLKLLDKGEIKDYYKIQMT